MRRLLPALAGALLAAAGLVPVAPAAAACGPDDPYDHPSYTLYWYECRRKESPRPELLPSADPTSGSMTVCVEDFTGGPPGGRDCRKVNLFSGTVPSAVCRPSSPLPVPIPTLPHTCVPLPSIRGEQGSEPPKDFDYDGFKVCPHGSGTCYSTFHHVCVVAADGTGTKDLACAGAGIQPVDPHKPQHGVKRLCVAAGTPIDRPGEWSMLCVPFEKVRGATEARGRV